MGWTKWNELAIKAVIEDAEREGLRDAAHVILDKARGEVPLDEGTLLRSGTIFESLRGLHRPQVFITFGGGGNTGQPVIPYARRWHENSAAFQFGRKKRYLADPFNKLALPVTKAAIARRLKQKEIKTK